MIDPPPAAKALAELIKSRRSIRRFRADLSIDSTLLRRLLEAATWAPSAHNRQPWRFAVIVDESDKGRLADAMGRRLRVERLADGDDPAEVEADVARSYERITGAPVIVVVFLTMADMDRYPDERRATAEHLMAVQSVAMAAQNLLLTAHAEGLGACWMCAPLFAPDVVCQALGVSADWEPQGMILFGYPAETGRRRSRKPVSEVVKSL